MPAQPLKNIFLTGASSGIGRAMADHLLQGGHHVWGTSRNIDRFSDRPNFHPLALDLQSPESISRAWKAALEQAGEIDVVIQNAGSGIFGSIEEVSAQDAAAQWQILVQGPLQILQLAAGHMRARGVGLIIGISSLAAELPIPFSAHYSAGKAAFSSLLATLHMELRPFGVDVVDLRPGDIKTAFIDSVPQTLPPESPYLPWAEQTANECARLMINAPSPDLIAEGILKLIGQTSPAPVIRLGTFFQAKLSPLGVRLLPWSAMLKSIRKYYGLAKIDDQQRARK